MEEAAEAAGWYSDEVEGLAAELSTLISQQEKMNLLSGGKDLGEKSDFDAITEREEATGVNAIVSVLGGATTALGAFTQGILNAASSSAVVSSVMSSVSIKSDKAGNMIGLAFDPMMMLVNIIGRVLERSEAFATILKTLDSMLVPLVEIADQLFSALQPIVEVAVALFQTAMQPLVWIISEVVAPVLLTFANVIKGIWNAIARFLNNIPGVNIPVIGETGSGEGIGGGGGEESPPRGSIAWYEDKLSDFRKKYDEATSDAERERLKSQISRLENRIEKMRGDTPERGSLAFLREQLQQAREDYEMATDNKGRQAALDLIETIEAKIAKITGEEPPGEGPTSAGTNISEITGPTRDLLIDLLRPLSILPSWTSMIQDIRNDVRAIAINSGAIGTGNLSLGTASIASASSAQGNTVYSFNNVTITTSASNVRDLTREISRFTYKEGRTGK